MDCIFCKIINKEAPADIIYEDEYVLGFKNIHREANVHLLFVPKKHVEWSEEDLTVLSKVISAAKKVAIDMDIFNACKFIFNIGETGHIPHIHLHLLGGWKGEVPKNNI
jgi:histidine triad (HIT) family protein